MLTISSEYQDDPQTQYYRSLGLLRQMLDANATYRPGQWEAIKTIACDRSRCLIVQRTGWGKSLVYFMATKLLREQGKGPTLLISPLLSLMRNQIEMAARIGIRALTINSTNRDMWNEVEEALVNDCCDILLISPERLNNQEFMKSTLSTIAGRIGLFVVDEAHCISDWGHDFRPDYQRITRILQRLPDGVPVLGTTATANDRVIDDIVNQLGSDLLVLRGSLKRETLRLQNLWLPDQSARMSWLAENLPRLPGSGIVYCLTVADTERVSRWLQLKGIRSYAYHAGDDSTLDRESLEEALLNNEIKVLVSTVALGMGFDKPDLGFVVHFQRPGSVVAYYQQVGRAGRAVERAYGILLSGVEDDEIQDYFIGSAFPSIDVMKDILNVLEETESLSVNEILSEVNVRKGTAEKALRLLELDGAVGVEKNRYFRTPNPWHPDLDRIQRVTSLRRLEMEQMKEYIGYEGCLMEFLCQALDDPTAAPCGICANCQGKGFSPQVTNRLLSEAVEFLKREELIIKPRIIWPPGVNIGEKRSIPLQYRNNEGRSLCDYGDAGWGPLVRNGKYQDGFFSEELIKEAANFIKDRWQPNPMPTWMTAIPSHRRPHLVYDYAQKLADYLHIPFYPVLTRSAGAKEQKSMENSAMQARNVLNTLTISGKVLDGPVLLVDDIVDSRWTMTLAGWLLLTNGSGPVFPFTLARAVARNT